MESTPKLSISQLLAWANTEAEHDPVFRKQMDQILNKAPGQQIDPYSIIESTLSEEELKIVRKERETNPTEYVTDGFSISTMHAQMKGLMTKVEDFQLKVDEDSTITELEVPIPAQELSTTSVGGTGVTI